MKNGSILVEVHDVYEYQVTQYDPQTRSGGLFVQYIDTFLKLKAEVSGYPSWVQSPADEDHYISYLFASEDIKMDKDTIESNPAKRGLAKLRLNSMWGKLTERNDRTHTKMISEPQELYRFLAMSGMDFATHAFARDDVVWASWRYIPEEKVPNLRHTNDVIAFYVTAGARIHLTVVSTCCKRESCIAIPTR